MTQVKLQIQKLRIFNEKFTRYYTAEYVIFRLKENIFTEAQLAYYIYSRHGVGRYLVLAFMEGNKGFFKYWNGDITENGFVRDRDKNREIARIESDYKKDLKQSLDYEEREMLEELHDEELAFEKETHAIEKKKKRPQCYGLLKSRPGQLNQYQEF